ncbi:MAG: hypothetical protein AAB573_05520 [Patescibacteria group bacterium]
MQPFHVSEQVRGVVRSIFAYADTLKRVQRPRRGQQHEEAIQKAREGLK